MAIDHHRSSTYLSWKPEPPLADWIESFSVQESPGPSTDSTATRVLPSGRVDLVFSYGDPFVSVGPDAEEACPSIALSGQRTSPTFFRATGSTGLFLIHFHPWASRFFAPASELTDRQEDLTAILERSSCDTLLSRLREPSTVHARAKVVEEFLIQRLPRVQPDACVVQAIRLLSASSRGRSVAGLAEHLGMSRRHLGRLFLSHVGTSPKMMARILRFQDATRQQRAGFSWSEAAARSGFTDQAHLTREFTRFGGVTPGTLQQLVARAPLQSYFNSSRTGGTDWTLYL